MGHAESKNPIIAALVASGLAQFGIGVLAVALLCVFANYPAFFFEVIAQIAVLYGGFEFIRCTVALLNRRDDPRHARPPPDFP